MTLKVGDELVPTNIGVVQGGVCSPLQFSALIDSLVVELNKHARCLALADDLVIVVKGTYNLNVILG